MQNSARSPPRRSSKPTRSARGGGTNNQHMTNSSRIFVGLVVGFVAMTSVINMKYHRKATETMPDHRISAAAFKNEPRDHHGGGTTNAGGGGGGNRMGDLSKEHGDIKNTEENGDDDDDGDGGEDKDEDKDGDDDKEDDDKNQSDDDDNDKKEDEKEDDDDDKDADVDVSDESNHDGDQNTNKQNHDGDGRHQPKNDGGSPIDTTTTTTTKSKSKSKSKSRSDAAHPLAGLSCADHGGPPDSGGSANEMVYWSDIPADSPYESPFKKKASSNSLRGKKKVVQYMTFEPDEGGWNNIRMAMETVVVMAHAMGRTLVLPPSQGIYLLEKDRDKQNTVFSFADFFHLESIHLEHPGIDIVTTEEFLVEEAMAGNLRDKETGAVSFPPQNRTDWNGGNYEVFKKWLRSVTMTPLWQPDRCIATFPASTGSNGNDNLNELLTNLTHGKDLPRYLPTPTPVDATTHDRMREMRMGRSELCIYNTTMQNAPVLHFMVHNKIDARLLVHFYAFLFFEDWRQQLWTNRFVRDHLRYVDGLQCAAARVVEALRATARENGSPDGAFDTFHVRRGDFQFRDTRLEAEDLDRNSRDLVPENATLYIATDERNRTFFDPIVRRYRVYFLDDFKHLFGALNTNYYGMLDQLIASRGRTFVGTFYSTFTGYINRMRGYHAQRDRRMDRRDVGAIDSYFFFPKERKRDMRRYARLHQPVWAREFPTSWRDIDRGIGDLR